MSIVGYDNAGESDQPSPSIWGDCPNTLLNDKGLGFFADVQFMGAPTGTLAAALDVSMISFGGMAKLDADTDTVLAQKDGERGGCLTVTTDGDDNDAAAVFIEPFGKIVKNSGQRLWMEAIIALGDISEDFGAFVGLAERDALDGTTGDGARDVVDDGAASNGLIEESVIGFIRDAGDLDAWDAVYKKDAGTEVNPLTDVTNATAIDSDDRASLEDNVFFKLGLTFDGRDKLKWWVDGIHVATQTVDSTIDQSHDFGAVVCIKTGTAAAEQYHLKRLRVGFQERH